jgi:hypothetical protein
MLALSLPGQLETVGSLLGFAAILGLAVLSLLYFAQARELKRLREWAEDAGERAVGAPQAATPAAVRRVPSGQPAAAPQQPARVQTAPQAQPAAAPAPKESPSPQGSGARSIAAPALMGAPALASATRFGSMPAAPARRDEDLDETIAPGAATAEAEEEPHTQVVAPPALTPAAARAGQGGNGHSDRPVAPPPPRRPPAPRPAQRPSPQRTMPPSRGGQTGAGAPAPSGGRRRGWVAPVLTGVSLLLLAGIAFAAVQFLTGGNDSNPNTPAASKSATTKRKAGQSFSNGNTTVAVLNGTPTAGLAKKVATELVGAGFKQGTVTNASDQARSATIISFFPGHRVEARRVRGVLKGGSVEPIDPTTRAIACIKPDPCPSVVVTVGADRAQ